MANLSIADSVKTPYILFESDKGILEIKGKSIPENSIEFYKPVFEWLEGYSQNPAVSTEFRVRLEYFNTSSSKCILDIFRKLELIHAAGKSKVKVCWYYEADDEDMMEAGEDYKAIVKVPFEIATV